MSTDIQALLKNILWLIIFLK